MVDSNDRPPEEPPPIEVMAETAAELVGEAGVVLAADVLPETINIVPGSAKPIFPGMVFPVVLAGGPLVAILQEMASDEKARVAGFVLAREEVEGDDAETIVKKLHRVGTAARVINFQEDGSGGVRALLQGLARFEILKIGVNEERIVAQVAYLHDADLVEDERSKAMGLAIINTMRELMKNNPIFSEEIKMFLSRATWDDPGRLADFAVSITASTPDEMQEVLEELNVIKRLEQTLFLLRKELDLNELKEKITHQIEERISKHQREFFLHEQLKAIKQELGLEVDDKADELAKYEERLAELDPPDEAKAKIEEEIDKLKLLGRESPEYTVVRNYLDWLTALPWGVTSKDRLDVAAARRVLNREHHGLADVKERILEFIGVSKLRGTVEGSILCLIGPPGVGKTSLGRAVAEALGRKFFRFSLGGMKDEAEIKGHRRTYIGAMPGKIIQTLRYSGTQNPVIMLDEIDKVGVSYQGDPASALLEVLDPEQNNNFLDHYLDAHFDLSKVLFIATANVADTIPAPLLDRMEVIPLSGYIQQEKLVIAKRHLIPRLLPTHGLEKSDLRFTDGGLKAIISGYAREAGVRALEKAVRGCLRKVAARKAEGLGDGQVVVTAERVEDLLGRPPYPSEELFTERQPGVATGLAWTALGGTVLFVEAMAIPGKGGLRQTGQLGDVMVESTSIAFSFVNANRQTFGIDDEFFEKHNIHLHVPAGATPKDGPSAGVTMATALISMATGESLPLRLAMTGELTLTGKVLPVGGIKEKIIAARRAGVADVIMPAPNERDFEEIPDYVRNGITPHFVDKYAQIHALLFAGDLEQQRQARRKKPKRRRA